MKKISAEAAKKRREYYKQWRSDNRDKVKEYQARYWEKKAAAALNAVKNK